MTDKQVEPLRERLFELGQVKYDGTIAFTLSKLTQFINAAMADKDREIVARQAQLDWINEKLRQCDTYEPPMDGRNQDSEIKGWMHVLVASHNSLHKWLPMHDKEKRESNAEIALLKRDLAQARGDGETTGLRCAAKMLCIRCRRDEPLTLQRADDPEWLNVSHGGKPCTAWKITEHLARRAELERAAGEGK